MILSITKLVLLLAGGTLLSRRLFNRERRPWSFAETALHCFVGVLIYSHLFLCARYLQVAWTWALVPACVASLWVLFEATFRRGRPAGPGRAAGPRPRLVIPLVIVLALYLAPTLVAGWRMGTGPYPAAFFNVDSPFYLHHVHALLQHPTYPPPSLEVYGLAHKYHYGAQAAAAFFSAATRLAPHTAIFLFVIPFGMLVYCMVVLLIMSTTRVTRGLAFLGAALFLFGARQHLVNYFDLEALAQLVLEETQVYAVSYPLASTLYGSVLVLALLHALRRRESSDHRWLAAFLVASMAIIKVPYIPFVAAGFGAVVLVDRVRRRRHSALVPAVVGLAALGASALLFGLDGRYVGEAGISLRPFAFLGYLDKEDWITMACFVIPLSLAWRARRRAWRWCDDLAVFTLALPLLSIPAFLQERNAEQLYDALVPCVVLFCILSFLQNWQGLRAWPRLGLLCGSIALVVPSVVASLSMVERLVRTPAQGHEYVDNSPLADILARIPVEGSLIITNGLRYPAQGFKRDERQFQFAALFGHQNFATNFHYVPKEFVEGRELRRFTALLSAARWDQAEIERYQARGRFTHLVIHKRFPRPTDIPLPMIYENESYALYEFPRADSPRLSSL